MKKALQMTIAILSSVPLTIGVIGIVLGTRRWLPTNMITPDFDSHYRYIAGYYVSLGLLGLWIIPKIERHTGLFRVICASVFMGGVGRVASIVQVGLPGPMGIFFTVFELCFPLLILWQTKVSRLQPE
jgi:Domain of unknown function (DUF4345)